MTGTGGEDMRRDSGVAGNDLLLDLSGGYVQYAHCVIIR